MLLSGGGLSELALRVGPRLQLVGLGTPAKRRRTLVRLPSHANLGFDSCASAGCHNFHDNRALYEDFLVKHAGEPWLASSPVHALAALARTQEQPAESVLVRERPIAPAAALADSSVLDNWVDSGHDVAGVGCAACHAASVAEDAPLAEIEDHWIDSPPMALCEDCHRAQARTFALGRHGMRSHPLIAKPRDPDRILGKLGLDAALPETAVDWLADRPLARRITPAEARLPMRADASHRSLHCGTCHTPHDVDTRRAAVQACASCHDDRHNRAYFESPHHTRWRAELAGAAPPGAGVSCATCHMLFRFGAERVMDETDEFSYSLLSLSPINKKRGPGTEAEKEGLQYVVDNPGENFYGEEDLGGDRYFTAVYADVAVVEACVNCHNNHKDSPRTDLEVGEVMGGVVIRLPMD